MRIPRAWKRGLLLALSLYTVYSAGPFAWVAIMSLRTTSEISADPYALPERLHWEKYATAYPVGAPVRRAIHPRRVIARGRRRAPGKPATGPARRCVQAFVNSSG